MLGDGELEIKHFIMAEEKLPHTAIPTWSGFIYQGRVALFHVLKLLNEETRDDCNLWYLQIDSIEDFSIVKYDINNNIIPLTIHQVKAVKSSLYSTYKEDFEQLEEKKVETKNDDVVAYFHLASKNNESKTNIQLKHPNLKIYTYENNKEYCSLSEIDNFILKSIEDLLQKENVTGASTDEVKRNKYEILEKKISDIVIEIHSRNHQGQPIRDAAFTTLVFLPEFLKIICDETIIIQSEQYFGERLKMDLNRYYQEYYFESDGQEWSNEVKQRMSKYLFHFNKLQEYTFKSFLQNIIPHKAVNYTDIIGYKDTSLNQDEMKEAFFLMLSEIKESNSGDELGWICSDGNHYYPTSINSSDSDASKKKVCEKILNTALTTNVSIPFDADFLVTSECNVSDMEAYANNISQVSNSELDQDSEDRSKNITQWKKVSLVDIQNAKNKLND